MHYRISLVCDFSGSLLGFPKEVLISVGSSTHYSNDLAGTMLWYERVSLDGPPGQQLFCSSEAGNYRTAFASNMGLHGARIGLTSVITACIREVGRLEGTTVQCRTGSPALRQTFNRFEMHSFAA